MHSEITSRPFLVRRAGVAQRRRQGVAIVTVLIFSAVLMALLASYVTMTLTESRTLKASSNGRQGFYSAEAGLNLRAELVRAKFVGYLRPIGTGPTSSTPCSSGDLGTGDMACITYHNLNGRDVVTYMTDVTTYDASGNPESGTVGPGDTYAGLNYSQYAYQVNSVTTDPTTHTKVAATLQMKFQSRLVPLFQFAAFSTKDLEFHPGVAMTLSGRVHTNANLYLNAAVTLDINGKTTAGGTINRFGNDGRGCTGTVRVYGTTMGCTSGGTALTDAQLQPFNKNVLAGQQILTVPPMSSLNPDPTGNSELWTKADLRVVAVKSGGSWTLEARTSSNQRDGNATSALNACNTNSGGSMIQIRPHTGNNSASDTSTDGLWDGREKKWLTIMDIDQSKLMDCIRTNALSGSFLNPSGGMLDVNDTTGGGLAWHFSFDDSNAGTNSAALYPTNYAVEISNGSCIGVTGACTNSALTQVKGLTVASNQQIYLRGNYNDVNKKPAAVLADAINILSSAVAAGAAGDIKKTLTPATATTVNAAFLSGIDTTVPGWSYNGGLQNYPRLHENWGGATFTYRGSFVSLGNSVHVQGLQACAYLSDGVTQAACGVGTYYGAPTRNWDYDTSFNDVNNLPPLTPRFVYLRQLLFARTY